MSALVILLRLIHITGGVMWVGFGVFMALVLGPAMERMGPDGAKVLPAIGPSLHTKVMPLIAILTILSGAWLYWIVSGGFSPVYMRSRMGMALGTGGVAAITTFILGLVVIRPAMTKSMMLMQGMGSAPADQKSAIAAEAKVARDRAILFGKIGTTLLVVATVFMAVARYL